MKRDEALYFVALLLMPLSYATKHILGISDAVWVNPSLVIAFYIFLTSGKRVKSFCSVLVLITAMLSTVLGFMLLRQHGVTPGPYDVIREPLRLTLNMVWFWVSLDFIIRNKALVLNGVAVSVLLQGLVAGVLWLSAMGVISLPFAVGAYTQDFAARQAVWGLAPFPIVRMGGTFSESPQFGLFMLSGALILSPMICQDGGRHSLRTTAFIVALTCAVASLADQVLIALLIMMLGVILYFPNRNRQLLAAGLVALLLITSPYITDRLSYKLRETNTSSEVNVIGMSGAERYFHTRYGLGLLGKNSFALPFGIGPGQYGHYVAETGMFPSTTNIQVTISEWIIEYGIFGAFTITLWLLEVLLLGRRHYGPAAFFVLLASVVGIMFQSNWKWESWFLVLAFLVTPPVPISGQHGI